MARTALDLARRCLARFHPPAIADYHGDLLRVGHDIDAETLMRLV